MKRNQVFARSFAVHTFLSVLRVSSSPLGHLRTYAVDAKERERKEDELDAFLASRRERKRRDA